MTIIKLIYFLIIFVCSLIFIMTFDISYSLSLLILCIVSIPPLIYHICYLIIKSVVDSWINSFFKILSTELKPSEFIEIFSNCFILYNHTFKNIKCIVDKAIDYSFDNLSEKSINIVINAIDKATDSLRINKKHKLKLLRINDSMKMKFVELFYYYINCEHSFNGAKAKLKYLFSILFTILLIPLIIFLLISNLITFLLIPLSLFTMYFVYHYLYDKIYFPIIYICLFWFLNLMFSFLPPIMLSCEQFLTFQCLAIYVFYLLALIIFGLWLTNNIWTITIVEKNKGSFISTRKLSNVIETKSVMKIRFPWLWITFFGVIIITILSYAFVFYKQLNLGNLPYCILYSISLYFGETPPVSESIVNWYMHSETVISFLINTLYLANIARILFEPKVAKKNF